MEKEYYCRQKFLMEKINSNINLDNYYELGPDFLQDYKEQINLFDDNNISRSIDISELDATIDTLEDFTTLISKISHVDILYILDTRKTSENIIIKTIQTKSLKAYIQFFSEYGTKCKIIKIN